VGQHDRRTPITDELGTVLLELARAVCRSWYTGFQSITELPRIPDLAALPDRVELRVPEGFAFYAVYPEAYVDAARRLTLEGPPQVIGIRSIGTTLGAVVAAALGAAPPGTLRPFGDPFDRHIAMSSELERDLLKGDAHYVIVDEGPGQSGSSFGAVADWLQEHGVALDRIAFIPSHAGSPGPQASATHLRLWHSAQRSVGTFRDDLPHLLQQWAEPLLGSDADVGTA